jgi:diguanylate cyclase (GGDEF)-like protein
MDSGYIVQGFALFKEVGELLASTHDLQRIIRTITEKVHGWLKPESTSLLLLDEGSQELRCELAVGSGAEQLQGLRIKLGEGAVGWSAQTGQPLLLADLGQDSRFSVLDSIGAGDSGSILCVPIRGNEKVLGAFRLANGAARGSFNQDAVSALTVVAVYLAIALENERYFKRIHALTITDDCTGLYNARHLKFILEAEVYRSTRFGHEFSLVFMDLDCFKKVNDEYGHQIGSKLLGLIGDLVKRELRLIDSAFRYGGDEFVLLLPQTSKPNALVVVRRLREALHSHVFFSGDGLNVKTSASYGVASFPIDGTSAHELLLKADQAMYKVKMGGGDAIALANDEGLAR